MPLVVPLFEAQVPVVLGDSDAGQGSEREALAYRIIAGGERGRALINLRVQNQPVALMHALAQVADLVEGIEPAQRITAEHEQFWIFRRIRRQPQVHGARNVGLETE